MKVLAHVLARLPSTALIVGDRTLSWAELDDLSLAFVERERALGIARGDRVAVVAHGGVDAIVALLAHHRSGVVHVAVNPGAMEEERRHVIADCSARAIFHEGALTLTGLESKPAADDVAMLVYTSGTTGKSKGCTLTFANVDGAVEALATLWELDRDDEVVNALPLFHVHGLCVALQAALLKGARTRLVEPPAAEASTGRFSPAAVVDAIAKGGSVFMAVPTMYRRLLVHLEKHPADADVLAGARLFTAGSAALPAADLEDFERRTGHRIVERYGMSETLITFSNPLHGARKAGSVGRPVPGVSMRIVDDELYVKGPGVMRGYWADADATERTFVDGWFKTGDLVAVDDEGYVKILGRASTDFVKVGGHKVSTREIEDQIATLSGIVEVCVVGVPDREWGHRIVACVVLAEGTTRVGLLERMHAHIQLAKHKQPRALFVVEALPRNAMGKVQKKHLEQRVIAAGV